MSVLTTSRLIMHLRKLILNKYVRPGTDFNALIEKRHKDANLKIFRTADPAESQTRTHTTVLKRKSAKSNTKVRNGRQVSLTDDSSDLSETAGDSTVESDDSVVRPTARRRIETKSKSAPFRMALRLFRASLSRGRSSAGPSKSCGTMFIDNSIDTAARCFDHVD